MPLNMEHIKCVVVGDGTVGKTSMLSVYANNSFPQEHVPTVFDNFSANLMVENKPCTVGLWDTAGQETYDRLRPLSYPDTNIFMVVFSIASPTSFENVTYKWLPEIRHHNPDTPFILVGNKVDLRSDKNTIEQLRSRGQSPVSTSQGEKLVTEKGGKAYKECSAMTTAGIEDVFKTAVSVVLKPQVKKKKPGRCTVL